ncbi:MAG: hypothetical protein O3C28_10365 [Proteobacteria bacterium]|nr:hypothetical protein [Pseudomonadota bacterium]
MPLDHNRFLLQYDRLRREINREIMGPAFESLERKELEPLLRLVATARCAYIKELLTIAAHHGNTGASREQLSALREKRETFEDLVAAANALETIIERGYLDVESI